MAGPRAGRAPRHDDEADDLRIEACEALGQRSDAQTLLWKIFAERLSLPHFRAYQRSLGDYDAIDAEERALDHLRAFPDKGRAMAALLEWPSPGEAARLVDLYATALDGRDYNVLRPAAQMLSATHQNAASLLYRLLIEAVLDKALSRYYPYAAKDFPSCAALAPALEATRDVETHDAFVARLRSRHKRKAGFWSLVE